MSWYWWGLLGVGVLLAVGMIRMGQPAPDRPSLRARLKRWRYRAKQRGTPGELPSSPLELTRLADAESAFKSKACPAGHRWPAGVTELDAVRLGDERILVVGRKCGTCGASEHRYVRLRSA